MNVFKKICSIWIILAIALSVAVLPVSAAATDKGKTVRVGYYITPGFQEYDEATGTYSGYNYEFLLALAQYTGWNYEFVPVDFSDALTKLASGEIDLAGNISYTEERESLYEFSALPGGQNYACLVMLPERADEVAFEEFSKFSTLTVAMVPGRSYSDDFIAYCKNHNCMPQIKYYDTSDGARKAWQDGEVDAYVCTSTYNMDYHILAKFHPEDFYFAATKGNKELINELDEAMNSLTTEDPYFESTLYNKYYSNMAENNCTLTDDEKTYIAEHPVMKVVYDETEYPISYKDKNGEFAGAMRDIYDEITKKTGLKFEFISCDSDVSNAEKTAGTSNYLIAELPYDYKFADAMNVYLTCPFATLSCMKISRSNDEDGGVMAVVDGYYMGQLCEEVYGSKYTYVAYPSTKDCIEAVKSGKADATCTTSYEYEYYSSQSKYRSLYYKVASGVEYQLCIAANKNVDSEIKSIMGKALNVISTEEIGNILRKTTMTVQRPDLLTLLYQHPQVALPVAIIVVLLLAAILLLLVVRKISRKNQAVLEAKNEQLKDAMTQANAANQSKGQFLAQMSHEIRTPMNAVVGMTAMAHKSVNDPKKTTEYLDKIDTASKMLLGIINDVLDMSAIEGGKLKIASTVFDLKQIITGITTVYYPQCGNKGIDLSVSVVKLEHEILIGDSLRVNQILMNLMSNAYKFTEKGGHIRFEITERPAKDGKVFMQFVVADDGCGMSDDLKARLFNAFEQESADTARKHGGSGLGLAITKNLIDKMHGAVEVESALGKGTTFRVSLPFEPAPDQTKSDPSVLEGMKALVVDDDPGVIEYTTEILSRMGVAYDTALGGAEALRLVDKKMKQNIHYDVCLIDWKMPDIDGVELTKRLRKIVSADTLVIIVSAYDLSEVQEQAKEAGANLYLEKPFFQSTLFNALMSVNKKHTEPKKSEDGVYDFTGKRILLVDDFDMNLEVATDILQAVHAEVDQAEDGRQAVDLFEQSKPGTYDVILMDIQMPVMDGLEAARQIRHGAHPQAKTIPIFAMTANAFSEDVASALNAGMNGHIAKPVDTEGLYKLLRETFDKANTTEGAKKL